MPPRLVYAIRPITYHGQQIIIDEVFSLRGDLSDEGLLRGGYVALLPPGSSLYRHVPTDRHFVRRQQCDAWRLIRGGERITPTHPDFPWLYEDYLVSPHPVMIPEPIYEALAPSYESSPSTLLSDPVPVQGIQESAAVVTQEPPARNPGGRRSLSPAAIAEFQNCVIRIVKKHARKNNGEEIQETRVMELMDLTIQKWRTRIKRVYKLLAVHGVKDWETFLSFVLSSKN